MFLTKYLGFLLKAIELKIEEETYGKKIFSVCSHLHGVIRKMPSQLCNLLLVFFNLSKKILWKEIASLRANRKKSQWQNKQTVDTCFQMTFELSSETGSAPCPDMLNLES